MTFLGVTCFQRRVIPDPKPGISTPPLMIRYTLVGCEAVGGIYLHKFMRSDHDRALHDHPWPYVALILKGGYWEWYWPEQSEIEFVEWRGPGSLLCRPAVWRHRVILDEGATSWSLCFVGPRARRWGFWVSDEHGGRTWCYWRRYSTEKGICEDHEIHTAREEE